MRKLLCFVLLMLPTSVFANVVFYGQCEYKGPSVTLGEGVYNAEALQRAGIPEDAIASVKVPSGFVVTLYADDGFSGRAGNLKSSDSCLTNDGFDKLVSSLKIEKTLTLKQNFGEKKEQSSGGALVAKKQPANLGSVTVYTDCNFEGLWAKLPVGDYNLAQLKKLGIGNNEISSVKVPKGLSVSVFENDFLRGDTATASADVACIDTGNFANRITSLTVGSTSGASTADATAQQAANDPVIRVFTECNYRGKSASMPVGEYNNKELTALGFDNNSISSIKLAKGYEAELFINDFQRGQSGTLKTDNPCLVGTYDDAISSIVVRKADGAAAVAALPVATLYLHCNFKGGSVELPVGRHDATALKTARVGDNTVSSIKISDGYRATLFDGTRFNGSKVVLTGNDECLDDNNINEKLSSIIIEPDSAASAGNFVAKQNEPTQSKTDDLIAGLTCVQGFVDKELCDADRWSSMERRCGLSKVKELSDGYLQGHVEAGNCNAELWNELVRRTANPHLRER